MIWWLCGCLCSTFLAAQAVTSVRGTVVDIHGQALSSAEVAVVPVTSEISLSRVHRPAVDARGQFQIEVPAGRYGFTVTAPGCLPHFQSLDLRQQPLKDALEVRMTPGGTRLTGKVVPVPSLSSTGVRVGFSRFSEDEGDRFFGRYNGDRFEISLAPGRYLALVEGAGQSLQQLVQVEQAPQDLVFRLQRDPWPAGMEVTRWIQDHAVRLTGVEAGQGFSDLQPLKAIIGDAKVVALGEATHGTREFFQLKHRLLEFLVSELGFTVFAIEANLPEAFAVDEYVLFGTGDPAQALKGMYFWTWETEEVLTMIRWMRAYNAEPAHRKKVRFYGVDMQFGGVAYLQAKAWLDVIAPKDGERLAALWGNLSTEPPRGSGAPDPAGVSKRQAYARELAAWVDEVAARSASQPGLARMVHNLRILRQNADLEVAPEGKYQVREQSMADNLHWIVSQEPEARVVLWVHNVHISKRAGAIAGHNGMGWHLHQRFGTSYRPIGLSFLEGGFQAMGPAGGRYRLKVFDVAPQPQATFDAAMASTGSPVAALDLRPLPDQGPVHEWLGSPQGTWRIGAVFSEEDIPANIHSEVMPEAYDAILFVRRTSPAQPVGGRKERFSRQLSSR